MSRDEIFAIWPRPWRIVNEGCVIDADLIAVATFDMWSLKSDEGAKFLAQMLVEWSEEER